MRLIVVVLLALGFAGMGSREIALARAEENKANDNKADGKDKKRKPQFTVGKETTYITGPYDENGYIDYATALNGRLRKDVTPDQNAVVLLWKATGPRPEGKAMSAEFYKWLGIEAPPDRGDYFIPQSRYAKEQLNIEPGPAWEAYTAEIDRAAQRPWTAKQYPRVAEWLKANDKPLAVVLEATKRPQYFAPLVPARSTKGSSGLISALLPNVQKCREMAQALTVRALQAVAEGRLEDAWRDLLACHRLGRLVARGPTLIEFLVGVAIDTIASNADVALLEHAGTDAKLDAKTSRGWLRDVRQLPPMPSLAEKVDLCERFSFLDSVMMIDRDGLEYVERLSGGGRPKEMNPLRKHALDGIDWDPALRLANQWFDRMVAAMRIKDRAERAKQLDQIDKDLKKLRVDSTAPGKLLLAFTVTGPKLGKQVGQIMVTLLMPAIHKVQQASDRSEQVQRNLHIAFALACYRREHGRYPDKLDALAPAYVIDVPPDIFSGEALIYRPQKQGYLLYSVGVNGRDDEGRGYGDAEGADDLSVRIPLPQPRRK